MQYSRKMGLDYGKARIGVAFGDLSSTIATADHIYKTKSQEEDLKYFANLIKEKGFFIRPSELFCNVIKSVKSDSATFTDVEGKTKSVKDNLNEYLEKIINESISRK